MEGLRALSARLSSHIRFRRDHRRSGRLLKDLDAGTTKGFVGIGEEFPHDNVGKIGDDMADDCTAANFAEIAIRTEAAFVEFPEVRLL